MNPHIVEYLDEKTRKPTGQYAKRFEVGLIDGIIQYRDEVIPKKIFCVYDAVGNIKSVTEVNFSYAVEVEGQAHCMDLKTGEEANEVLGVEMPIIPLEHKNDKLAWFLDHYKMGPKNAQGKREMVVKP